MPNPKPTYTTIANIRAYEEVTVVFCDIARTCADGAALEIFTDQLRFIKDLMKVTKERVEGIKE